MRQWGHPRRKALATGLDIPTSRGRVRRVVVRPNRQQNRIKATSHNIRQCAALMPANGPRRRTTSQISSHHYVGIHEDGKSRCWAHASRHFDHRTISLLLAHVNVRRFNEPITEELHPIQASRQISEPLGHNMVLAGRQYALRSADNSARPSTTQRPRHHRGGGGYGEGWRRAARLAPQRRPDLNPARTGGPTIGSSRHERQATKSNSLPRLRWRSRPQVSVVGRLNAQNRPLVFGYPGGLPKGS